MISRSQKQRIKTAVEGLNEILREVESTYPYANWYLDGTWNLNLMKGPAFDDDAGCSPLQTNILFSIELRNSSGGDW